MARASGRLQAAIAIQQEAPLICPRPEDYDKIEVPARNVHPMNMHDVDEIVRQLFHKNDNGTLTHQVFRQRDKNPIDRAADAYRLLPQSFKDRMWCVDADDLIANHNDSTLTVDTVIIPAPMKDYMWQGEVCVQMCADGVCPWIEDCEAFDRRKTLWNRQIKNSAICRDRVAVQAAAMVLSDAAKARKTARKAKKDAIRARVKAERILSMTMFNPKVIQGGRKMIKTIRVSITGNEEEGGEEDEENEEEEEEEEEEEDENAENMEHAENDPDEVDNMMNDFDTKRTPLTFLDFQCLIADYFHDGMPGFRITNIKDARISGIRVHHPNIIKLGKEAHHAFMYRFLEHVLTRLKHDPIPEHLTTLTTFLRSSSLLGLPTISKTLTGTHLKALEVWRESVGLNGRIEDSMGGIMGIPMNKTHYTISLKEVATTKTPKIHYNNYLKSKHNYVTITTDKSENLKKEGAKNVLTFLLLVLFGESYTQYIAEYPALFTFDAHKGHLNRLISKYSEIYDASGQQDIYRLITPYNISDSAMTENVNKPRAKSAEDAAIEAEVDSEEANVKVTKADVADNDEDEAEEDDVKAVGEHEVGAAQRGANLVAFSLRHAATILEQAEEEGTEAVMSDTNTLFDDNWLIYYTSGGFSRYHPFKFSMNLVDAGLRRYIVQEEKEDEIPLSHYTITAPFSAKVTRGPSLNYLMMGLLRGTNSKVFGTNQVIQDDNALYERLCTLSGNIAQKAMIEKLLPIYSIPASARSLPLFEYIAKAPLFAYHMLYDLQHGISALPSRIKWAGDREQYMALKDYRHGVFVTLDTTGYYCALSNGIASILERRDSIILIGGDKLPDMAEQNASRRAVPQGKRKDGPSASMASAAAAMAPAAASSSAVQKGKKTRKVSGGRNLRDMHQNVFPQANQWTRKNIRGSPPSKMDMFPQPLKNMFAFPKVNEETQTNVHSSLEEDRPHVIDRDYFFLEWLYPIVMAVNEAFYDQHHAEEAYAILQDLRNHIGHPSLFPVLQGQFIHAVSKIPDVSKKLLTYAKEITGETYEDVVEECADLLKEKYTGVSSIFSKSVHKKTILGYLRDMKETLSKKYSSEDSTLNLLHTLLDQPNQVSCLALSLLFERLHGRIHNKTSYLGEILGIDEGEALERVDDQEAWEYLTTVLKEDVKQITTILENAGVSIEEEPMKETMEKPMTLYRLEKPLELVEEPVEMHKATRHSSMKKHRALRRHIHRLWKRTLHQLRHPKRAIRGSRGSRGKTRRARQIGRRVTARGSKSLE